MSDLQSHLAVLADPTRVRLLAALEREELDVGELTRVVGAPQSTVSRHLKALRVGGWIHRRSEGTSGLFRMRGSDLSDAARALWAVVRDDFLASPQAAEDEARLRAVLDERSPDATSFFGRLGARWEGVRRELFGDSFLLPTLLSLLPPDLVVVDLGCGTGEVVAALAPVCAKVIGVDHEEAMLEVARARTKGLGAVDLRQAALEDLPLPDGSVDAALCMLVLHHVADPARILAEARRVLRPRGRVVVLDMVAHGRSDWVQAMGHRHLGFSSADLARHAGAAGLKVASRRDLPLAADVQGPPLFVATLVAR